MDRLLRVGVVGAGTAGAAVAIMLARAGHAVTLFERVAEPGPVGAGITLQPTGQAVLAQLGLLAAIEARATRVDGLLCRRPSGRAIVDLRYADVDPSLYGLGLHRGVLFETLFRTAQCEAHIMLRTGIDIVAAPREGLTRFLEERSGNRHGPFDLVVAADGANSSLHHEHHRRVRSTPYPWGAMWLVAEDRGGTLTKDRRVMQIVDGARRLYGLLPTGLAPRGDTPVVSVFWSIRADGVESWRRAGLASWRSAALRLDPASAPVVDQIESLDQFLFAPYRDVSMPQWHTNSLVFLGDAAHATSPQLGQGANLALWDAQVLAECVDQHLTVAAALEAYSATRRRHLRYYQFATRALTPFFQSNSTLAGWLRDLTFPMSRWLGPLRRRMVRTMCGLDRGFVRQPIPLEDLAKLRLPAAGVSL